MQSKLELILSGLQHYSNPLHVYCRFKDIQNYFGITGNYSRNLSKLYEKYMYRPVYSYYDKKKRT